MSQSPKLLRQGSYASLALGGGLLAIGALKPNTRPNLISEAVNDWFIWIGSVLILGGILAWILSVRVSIPIPRAEYEFRRAKRFDLKDGLSFASKLLPEVPSYRQVKNLYNINPTAFWNVYRVRSTGFWQSTTLVGLFSLVPLTPGASSLLENEELDGLKFTREHIAGPKEPVGAMYIGTIAARGFRARAETLGFMKSSIASAVDKGLKVVYTRPITKDGLRLIERHGFVPVSDEEELQNPLGRIFKREY